MDNHRTRRYGDTIECYKCGKQWDVDDPDPPSCISDREFKKQVAERNIRKIKKMLGME